MRWVIAGSIGLFGLVASWILAVPAHATSFDLSSCSEAGLAATCNNSDTGLTSLTYTVDSHTLGATGNGTLDLKLTPGSPGESGLGIFAEADHEVDSAGLVTLDFSDLAKAGATAGTLTVSSLQPGETGIVTDANGIHLVTGVNSTLLADVPISFSDAHPLVRLTATPGDVLAAAAVAVVPVPPVTVPEPNPAVLATFALIAAMVVGGVVATKERAG